MSNVKKKCSTESYKTNKLTSFDDILPEKPTRSPTRKNSITYKKESGTVEVITLNRSGKYHNIIVRACDFSIGSDWFLELSPTSKKTYFGHIRKFIGWLNDSKLKTVSKSRYGVLKKYEAHELNEQGIKRSPLYFIIKFLHEGAACQSFTNDECNYLHTLTALTIPVKIPTPEPQTLSSWFSIPWMRSFIGESSYMQLESPRLLFNSFRVTIATTLLYLLNARKQRQLLHPSVIKLQSARVHWYFDWGKLLFKQYGRFNAQGEPEDELSQLLMLDLVRPNAHSAFIEQLKKAGSGGLTHTYEDGNKIRPYWQTPILFHPEHQVHYSYIEELLFGWLVACESIQPSDIPKLKVSNYACEFNRSGRLITMQCKYYKSRSGAMQQAAILVGNDVWTQAMYQYIKGVADTCLFHKNIHIQKKFSFFTEKNTEMSLLMKIWNLPDFQSSLETRLKRTHATDLFLKSMLALGENDETYTEFHNRTNRLMNDYKKISLRPVPISVFSLTHIKNTSVHAASDTYRSSDLINHHSHTSDTEYLNYLTDANKEWVDQAGRVTRLVLNDLQNVIYKPSINSISKSVKEKTLRTQITDATNMLDAPTQSFPSDLTSATYENEIIVSDCVDTALYFIHYITQAENLTKSLVITRPDWVERTLIVQIEWMDNTLARMSTSAAAHKEYKKYAAHMPPLFDHLVETTE